MRGRQRPKEGCRALGDTGILGATGDGCIASTASTASKASTASSPLFAGKTVDTDGKEDREEEAEAPRGAARRVPVGNCRAEQILRYTRQM